MSTTNTAEIREANRRLSAADHAGTIRSFYPYWDTQYRPYLLLALDALPREHFDFKPRPEMLTAHQIILHIAENEWGFVHNIVDTGMATAWEHWIVEHEDPSQGWKTVRDVPDHAALRHLAAHGDHATVGVTASDSHADRTTHLGCWASAMRMPSGPRT